MCFKIPILLRPKVYEVLVYLVEHHGELVSKDDLAQEVWGGIISDAAINTTVNDIRRAIGEQGDRGESITTHQGRGYRFVAPVTVREERRPTAVEDTEENRNWLQELLDTNVMQIGEQYGVAKVAANNLFSIVLRTPGYPPGTVGCHLP